MNKGSWDALIVLGAVMEWNSKKGAWTFPTIIERYAGKLVMGKARALAASILAHGAPVVLVTGGTDKHPVTGEIASRAEELAKLIVNRYQVPSEKVVPIGTFGASHTVGNVENIIGYIEAHPDVFPHRRIMILSPRFQYERAYMMFDANPYFKQADIELDWILVENILATLDRHYRRWIKAVYASEAAKINREMEGRGIQALKSGAYRPVT